MITHLKAIKKQLKDIKADEETNTQLKWFLNGFLILFKSSGVFGREVVALEIWGLQKRQRDALATMVLLVL